MDSNKIPDYVKEIFANIAHENGFSDYALEVNAGCKPGDGYVSDIFCITLSNKENHSQKLELVCKIAPSNENNETDLFAATAFRNEALFYAKIMPIFAKFQEEKHVPKEEQFRSFPKCFATLIDDERERYVIVLEDLRPYGFRMWDKAKLTPIENLSFTMRELGRFHGLSIALKDQNPEEFEVVKQATDMLKISFETESIRDMFSGIFDNTIKSLKKEQHKDIMRNLKTNMVKYVETCLNEERTDGLAVLCHGKFQSFHIDTLEKTKVRISLNLSGDLWNNNILYRFNNEVRKFSKISN